MRITELLQDATIDLGVKVNSKEEAIDLVARDITSMEEWYALDPYYRAAFADAV